MLSIQYISDIHLEFYTGEASNIIQNAGADVLVLAGDIGKLHLPIFVEFLEYVCKEWNYVIFVPGNHEYYNETSCKESIFRDFQSLKLKWVNFYLLDRDIVTIHGHRFLGCTLWSSPTCDHGLNDFKFIYSAQTPITKTIMREWHEKDRTWLLENIQEEDIVITHFMPMTNRDLISFGYKSIYPVSSYDSYFGNSDMWEVVKKAKIWISGHTHQQFKVDVKTHDIHSCLWVCNPSGYPGENTGSVEQAEVLFL